MPLLASNFTSNLLYGSTIVAGGWANINLTVDAFALEGDKTFVVKLRKDSINGQVIGTSAPITIKDYTTLVGLAANISTVNEGNLVQMTLTTTNVVNYTNVAYSVFPVTANVTSDDFVANTGYITIINNVGTFALKANADLSLMDENGETFRVQIRDRNNTNVFISSNIVIGDVSRGINVLSFTENASSVAEGGTLTLTFTATNANNVILYYSTDGNATTSTFTGGNTGSFVLNGISNTVTLLPVAVPYSTTQNFNVVLRSDTANGPIVARSNNIIAMDGVLAYMSGTGGTITDSGGYRVHAFTTSGNLTINSLGAAPTLNTVDYLVVAGGAAGGRSGGSLYNGGGGGGAGGALLGNIIVASTGNSTIVVGAGGALVGNNEWPLPSGGNTTVTFTGTPAIVVYGGGGGAHSWPDHGAGFGPGRPGGSGGGGNFYGTFGTPRPAGTGTPGQGYSGGTSSPESYGGATQRTWAGGGGGAGEQGHWNSTTDTGTTGATTTAAGGNGIAVSWAPPTTGTSGPAPGRWFAGGGGGGSSPNGSAYILSGGAGGGGAGGIAAPGYPTGAQALGTASGGFDGGANATINTGGGGGGAGNGGGSSGTGLGGLGGSGVVIIRYPYTPPPTVNSVTTTASTFTVGANITFTVSTQNANLITLYYSTDGNVTASNFIGGNTGSFVANATGNVFTLQANTNIPLNESRQFRLQIRQDSTTGFISGSSANIEISGYSTYISATGGIETTSGGYKTHIFTTTSTLTVNKITPGVSNVEYLIVAGGGGGAVGFAPFASPGSAGGAGGLLTGNVAVLGQQYVITLGAGGTSAAARGVNGSTGSNSSAFGIVTYGGGGGTYNQGALEYGLPGGSGGGAGGFVSSWPDTKYGGLGTPGQGYPGGTMNGSSPGGDSSSGGGGAGGVGVTFDGASNGPRKGGDGLAISWAPPTTGSDGPTSGRWFAGGGGGSTGAPTGQPGAGGAGGGGRGANPSQTMQAHSGNALHGGGGGGGTSPSYLAGSGGSGIVIIRYPYA